MAGLTPLGAVHTAFALVALLSALLSYIWYREISPRNRAGQMYVISTFVTAATSLGIYQHGGFGFQHVLSILTLIALAAGTLATLTGLFGSTWRYVQAISFSSTILFHLLPGVFETLTRLPPGNPLAASYSAPLLKYALLAVLVGFFIGLVLQIRSLRVK